MTTTALPDTGHPDRFPTDDLACALDAIRWGLDAARHAGLEDVDAERTRSLLLEVTSCTTRLAELEGRLLHHGEQVGAGAEAGAPSTATWVALATHQTRKSVHRRARLAAFAAENPQVREAMACGELLPEQAGAILDEVRRVPRDQAAAAMTERLVRAAAHQGAEQLRIVGRRALWPVTPTEPDDAAELTVRPERSTATARPHLELLDGGAETSRGHFLVPRAVADRLQDALLELLDAGQRSDPTAAQLGEAFCELVRRSTAPVDGSVDPEPRRLRRDDRVAAVRRIGRHAAVRLRSWGGRLATGAGSVRRARGAA